VRSAGSCERAHDSRDLETVAISEDGRLLTGMNIATLDPNGNVVGNPTINNNVPPYRRIELEMAKDTVFPDDKLEWRPHPDARSVLDEFRQVTMGLEFSTAQLRGEKLDRAVVVARRKADAGKPKTRASMVSEMEAAIAISYPLVEKSPTPLLIGWIRDQAEHYGKLVSNYRAVGIVPPISR
jgi:hypothetical protein